MDKQNQDMKPTEWEEKKQIEKMQRTKTKNNREVLFHDRNTRLNWYSLREPNEKHK